MVVVSPPWTIARSAAAWCSKRSGTKSRTSTRGPQVDSISASRGPADQDQARLRDLGGDQGEGLRALAEQAPPDPRSPDGGQDHALVGPVAELRPQGGAVAQGAGIEVEGVAGEAEVLPRPLPHVREIGAELAIEHVLLVADQDRQVAHVGMEAQVVDVLRVLLPAADELGGGPVLPHRQQADEVGEEGVGRPLEIGILVEEVVEVPPLVADPQVVALALDHVGEGHEVRGHDLVHVPQRVERVELVIGGPALEVPGLVLEQARGRVQALAPVLDDAVGRIAGEEVDDDVGIERPQPPGDREVALDVPEPDRAREPEHAPPAVPGRPPGRRRRIGRGNRARGGGRDRGLRDLLPEHEVADEAVDLHRVAAEQPVAAPLEGDQAGSGDRRDHLLRVRVGDDLVVGPVERQGGDPDLAEQVVQVDAVDRAQRLDQDLGGGLAGPGHAVLDPLERVRLREDALEQARPPVVEVVADHPRDALLERLRHRLGVLAGEQDQVREPVGMLDRVPERERGRARERDQGDGRPRDLVEDGHQVAVPRVQVVAGGRPVGSPVAARVHRDHPEVARQVRDLVLPHPAVRDDLALGQQEQIARPAAGDLIEDARVRPVNVHRVLLAPHPARSPVGERAGGSILAPAGHLVEDEGRAAAHRAPLVGRHHAHRRRVERGMKRPASDPAQDVVLERGQRGGHPAGDHDDLRVQEAHEGPDAHRERFAGLVDHRAGEGIAGGRLLEQQRRADSPRIAPGPRQQRRARVGREPLAGAVAHHVRPPRTWPGTRRCRTGSAGR